MPRIDADSLQSFARALMEAAGTPTDVAEPVAESLVLADLAGHGSHGVHRVPWYAGWIDEGRADPAARPEVVRESSVTATIDGKFNFGQVTGRRVVEVATKKAREHGVAAVGVRNGSHLGRMGEWAERLTDAGLLSASFVNTQGQSALVAPAGSTERRLGTHPLTFGVPTFEALEFSVVLDMATSQVAHGKISEREATGEPVPEGWAVTEAGEPLTDAAAFQSGTGAMLPLGGETAGYKGYGLAVIAELFAGLVGGGEVFGMETEKPWSNGAAFVAIDPTRFLAREEVVERVAALTAYLKEAEVSADVSAGVSAKGGDEVLLPGEAEHLTTEKRRAEGVPVPEGVFDELVELAEEQGIEASIPSPAE